MAKVPIDNGWAWCIVLGASINTFFVIGGMKSMGILFVHMIESFNATPTLVGWMLGLMSFGISVFAPIVTALGTRYSYRVVVIFGGIIMSLAFLLAALSPNIYYIVCVLGILVGIANGCLFTPSMIVVGQYFDRYRSIAMGIVMAGGSLGQLVLPMLMQYLLDQLSFFGCMLVYSALASNTIFAGLLMRPQSFYTKRKLREVKQDVPESQSKFSLNQKGLRPNYKANGVYLSNLSLTVTPSPSMTSLTGTQNLSPLTVLHLKQHNMVHSGNSLDQTTTSHHIRKQREMTYSDRSLHERKPSERDQKRTSGTHDSDETKSQSTCKSLAWSLLDIFDRGLLSSCMYWMYLLAVCMATGGYLDQFLYIPAYGREIGLTKYQVTWVLALTGIMDISGRIIGGVVNNLRLIKTRNFCAFSLFSAAGGIAVCLFIPGMTSTLIHATLLGFLGGMYIALYPVALVDLLGLELFPKAFSLTVMGIGLFTLALPPIFGQIEPIVGSYSPIFWICISMMAMGGVFFLLGPFAEKLDQKRTKSETQEQPELRENGQVIVLSMDA